MDLYVLLAQHFGEEGEEKTSVVGADEEVGRLIANVKRAKEVTRGYRDRMATSEHGFVLQCVPHGAIVDWADTRRNTVLQRPFDPATGGLKLTEVMAPQRIATAHAEEFQAAFDD